MDDVGVDEGGLEADFTESKAELLFILFHAFGNHNPIMLPTNLLDLCIDNLNRIYDSILDPVPPMDTSI